MSADIIVAIFLFGLAVGFFLGLWVGTHPAAEGTCDE